jgi:hypothetical protein
MKIDRQRLAEINGVLRCETHSKEEFIGSIMELTHTVYSHDDVYGQFCTINKYIECPPELAYDYLSNIYSLTEWTYSMKNLEPVDANGLHVAIDVVGGNTEIYCKVIANKEAMTIDYHCAWDQGKELWMIYLMRVVPAQRVLNKPGSVIFLTNCHHPHYDVNPYPELAPQERPWVGEHWDMFFGAHGTEMNNLKYILEYRHKNQLPIGPNFLAVLATAEVC